MDSDDATKLRRELIATRLLAYGLLFTLVLSLFGAPRLTVFYGGLCPTLLVAIFLGCRCGMSDEACSLPGSLTVTLAVASIVLVGWMAGW
jgi:hypothetical protein